jgi:L-2-hydroxyglutarate oxidase LhgO
MLTLLGDAEAAGATLALNAKVSAGKLTSGGIRLAIESSGDEPIQLSARLAINCAGHGAHDFARSIAGYDTATLPARYLAKGTYCSVSGRSPFSHHIYPIPVPGGLGTHVTVDMGGSAKLGPDVTWIADLNYDVDQQIGEAFKSACAGFWPGIHDRNVTPAYCGVRPKLSGPGGPNGDFQIQRVGESHHAKLINLFGIESPGLTSSLAIAEHLLEGL